MLVYRALPKLLVTRHTRRYSTFSFLGAWPRDRRWRTHKLGAPEGPTNNPVKSTPSPGGKPQSQSGRAVEDTAKPWSPNGARLRGSGAGWGTSELSAWRAQCSRRPEYEHAAGAGLTGGARGTGGSGAAERVTAPGPEGVRWSEGVPRACCGDSRSEPQRNTAARRRAEPVGPVRRTIGTCARSRAERTRDLTLWTHKKFTGLHRGTKRRRRRPEIGAPERDRERSSLAGDGAGARGHSLDRRSAEGVLRRLDERAPKKHSSKEADGASGPRSPDNRHLRPDSGRENMGSDPLDT
ncbi:hypothetical protein NDU88_004452 [Pleurodeles waltl]|uniref:Uncharacterized protein n=1 Tax=Pleurodeles waltl TaxID=8319 RepID=A0AAV7T7U1_PLEWA|nr:hypothetical protein NDU88_004452 [Pleurodeles waltl]